MTRLMWAGVVLVLVIVATGPTLVCVASALVLPLVAVLIAAAVLRAVWAITRRK